MKQMFVIASLLIAFFSASAQQGSANPNTTMIYSDVEHEPEFPGGQDKFYSYLMKAIKYNGEDLSKTEFRGHFVVQMIIEKDGSLSNVQILKGANVPELRKEILRVIRSSPRWVPGMQEGHFVRVRYTLPINIEPSSD